ncbi:hypothetical protein [Litoribacter populi]|uniref:hypothetical protein n=1 Tax=Litoribacter populi TaxID=2598460 RepID=UPI00117E6B2C|nr:hypothetical protein [Litoribacter populi]
MKLYREKSLPLSISKSTGKGPGFLKAKGNLDVIFEQLLPNHLVLNDADDDGFEYLMELKYFVKKESFIEKITSLIAESAGYSFEIKDTNQPSYLLKTYKRELAHDVHQEKLPENTKLYTSRNGGKMNIYGYTLGEVAKKLSDQAVFYTESEQSIVNLRFKNTKNLNQVFKDLRKQGITVEESTLTVPTVLLGKR